jgi:hypothetical protein
MSTRKYSESDDDNELSSRGKFPKKRKESREVEKSLPSDDNSSSDDDEPDSCWVLGDEAWADRYIHRLYFTEKAPPYENGLDVDYIDQTLYPAVLHTICPFQVQVFSHQGSFGLAPLQPENREFSILCNAMVNGVVRVHTVNQYEEIRDYFVKHVRDFGTSCCVHESSERALLGTNTMVPTNVVVEALEHMNLEVRLNKSGGTLNAKALSECLDKHAVGICSRQFGTPVYDIGMNILGPPGIPTFQLHHIHENVTEYIMFPTILGCADRSIGGSLTGFFPEGMPGADKCIKFVCYPLLVHAVKNVMYPHELTVKKNKHEAINEMNLALKYFREQLNTGDFKGRLSGYRVEVRIVGSSIARAMEYVKDLNLLHLPTLFRLAKAEVRCHIVQEKLYFLNMLKYIEFMKATGIMHGHAGPTVEVGYHCLATLFANLGINKPSWSKQIPDPHSPNAFWKTHYREHAVAADFPNSVQPRGRADHGIPDSDVGSPVQVNDEVEADHLTEMRTWVKFGVPPRNKDKSLMTVRNKRGHLIGTYNSKSDACDALWERFGLNWRNEVSLNK